MVTFFKSDILIMGKLQSLSAFQELPENQMKNTIGGVSPWDFVGNLTGPGEMCVGNCVSYTSDIQNPNGSTTYFNIRAVDKPCN